MKKGKREATEGIELEYQGSIRTLEENENDKYLEISESRYHQANGKERKIKKEIP